MVQALDKQILDYLPLLGKEEKQSLLSVIESFLKLKKDNSSRISREQYNQELDDALAQVKDGDYLSQDDVEKAANEW